MVLSFRVYLSAWRASSLHFFLHAARSCPLASLLVSLLLTAITTLLSACLPYHSEGDRTQEHRGS